MNLDKRVAYCHGTKMEPATDWLGRDVDECIHCHRQAAVVPRERATVRITPAARCAHPSCERACSAGRSWCRTHCNVAARRSDLLSEQSA